MIDNQLTQTMGEKDGAFDLMTAKKKRLFALSFGKGGGNYNACMICTPV